MQASDSIRKFVDYANSLEGYEKGEAQLFCDRMFRAFGHDGIIEARGALEAQVKFSSGRTKFVDCLWSPDNRDGVLIEMKRSTVTDLESHFAQARDYWIEMDPEQVLWPGAQKPRYIILCNFRKFIIYRDLTRVDELQIDDLQDRASALNFLLREERQPIFKHNVEKISQDAARTIGDLYKHLVFELGHDEDLAQRFILQCVLALFSEDFGLLPKDLFTEIVRECQSGGYAYDLIGNLFRQMANPKRAKGGRYQDVRYFNGGLFSEVEPLELDKESLDILRSAGDFNWTEVNPAIFGALFESTLNAKDRHTFGAHFTSEVDIQKIVTPTIIQPWNERLKRAKTLTEHKAIVDDLGEFRVLDPACGCGNFLYVAYQSLKDFEMQVIEKIADKFSPRSIQKLGLGTSRISTRNFLGIDLLPIAVEVSKMGMMVAKEFAADNWNARIGPLLSTLDLSLEEGLPLDQLDDVIVEGDAVFDEWPECDAIIGNPPYQSKNKMVDEYGADYVRKLRESQPNIPGRADYCVYWFKRAHDHLKLGQRAGLVGTNTVRQNYSREGGLDYIVANDGTIHNAVSTQHWSGDAAVDVSIVNWIKGPYPGTKTLAIQAGDRRDSPFSYFQLKTINSALSPTTDVSGAFSLACNTNPKSCFQGQTHGHSGFLLKPKEAISLINKEARNATILRPFLTANDLLARIDSQPSRYAIDFRKESAFSVRKWTDLFDHVKSNVYPDIKKKADKELEKTNKSVGPRQNHAKAWWRFWRPRGALMDRLNTLTRYIVCPQVAKRSIFEFVDSSTSPNAALIVFPFEDDYSFGILQSSIHWDWTRAKCSTLTGRYRYTSISVWESFPWPQAPSKAKVRRVEKAAKALREIRVNTLKKEGLSLRDLYRILEQSPSNPVTKAHQVLDQAVKSAYGMKKTDDTLSFLLELNIEVHDREVSGDSVTGPGKP